MFQDEDRPGHDGTAAALDADSVYGYDGANVNCTTYSNGSARRVKVKNGDYQKNGGKWPTATFTFTGVAFDLISVTSGDTGYIFLDVYQGAEAVGAKYRRWVVDTFYGYTRVRDGYVRHEWYWAGKWYVRNTFYHEGEALPEIPEDQVLPANIRETDTGKTYVTYEPNYTWAPAQTGGALYQIPVIKGAELPYGTYTVVVTAAYSTFFDHTAPVDPVTGRKDYSNGNYDFYFDAVRVYAPAEDYEEYNREYYMQDGEGWPQFIELRKNVISEAEAVSSHGKLRGAIFFDSMTAGTDDGSDLTDYLNYGPDNEVYLAPGQSISFALQCRNNGKAIDTVQIGAKKLIGDMAELAVSHTADGEDEPMRTVRIVSSSDMYYNVGDDLNWQENVSDVVTLTNVGQTTVSVTNVKITYKEIVQILASFAPMSRRMIKLAASAADAAYLAGASECFHRYTYSVTEAPTATEPGLVTAFCPDCGRSFEVVIPALADGDYPVARLDPTAAEDGWIEYTWQAEEDGATASFRVVLPALGLPDTYIKGYDTADDDENTGNENPGSENPGNETPGGGTPGSEVPGNEVPGGEAAGGQTSIFSFFERIEAFFRSIIERIFGLFVRG